MPFAVIAAGGAPGSLARWARALATDHGPLRSATLLATEHFNIPTGQPLRFTTSGDGGVATGPGGYLDPAEALAAATRLAAEGGT